MKRSEKIVYRKMASKIFKVSEKVLGVNGWYLRTGLVSGFVVINGMVESFLLNPETRKAKLWEGESLDEIGL